MAARRAVKKVVDWAALAPYFNEETMPVYIKLRADYEKTKGSLASFPETPKPIDWEYYKKNISKSSFVQDFQKKYEALTIPYPKDTKSAEIDMKEKEEEEKAIARIAEAKQNVVKLQAELDKILSMKPFTEMTVEEYFDYIPNGPELRRKGLEDAMNGRWYMGWM